MALARSEGRTTGRWWWPLLADLLCVLALALGGRNTHEPDETAWVLLAIAWPFALSAVVAHGGLTLAGRRTDQVWPEGVAVFVVTYALGMLLRGVSGRGLATGFLVVAAIFLAVTMLGWRGVARLAAGHRTRTTA